jgi:hypothetical protein
MNVGRPVDAQVWLVPDFDGIDDRADFGAEHHREEIAKVLRIVRRTVAVMVGTRPDRGFGDTQHHFEAKLVSSLDVDVKVVEALAG